MGGVRRRWGEGRVATRLAALCTTGPDDPFPIYILGNERQARRCDAKCRGATSADVDLDAIRDEVTLARCVFGNPFRPVMVDPSWVTSDVLGLAQGIY